MGTFIWIGTGTADLSVPGNWIPDGPPGPGDTAIMSNSNGSYTVTVKSEVAVVDTIRFSTNGTANEAHFSIGDGTALASLTTNTLVFAQHGNATSNVTINALGVFDITGTLTNNMSHTETINIDSGTGGPRTGGHLVLGNVNVGNAANMAYTFLPPTGEAGGLIEFTAGFVSGLTTTQTINGVAFGDEFQFDDANFTGDTVSYSGTTLTVSNGGTVVLTMDHITSATNQFVASGQVIEAVCYARGTMIATPGGELPVEKLRPGKQVIALVDGKEVAQTVTWLGHRRIGLAGHPRLETVAPIRILRGAFADNVPHRDLVVSPDHAIFVDSKLICARQLVNGTTVRQELDWTAVDYYHVELDEHAILLAEGLPAESYIDTGNSGFFANSGAPIVLHPDLTDDTNCPTREAGSCAPFVWDEASVRPVWQRLADRAAVIGRPVSQRATTTDACLRLRTDRTGRRTIAPIHSDSNLVIFVLPSRAAEVRLLSRAQSPTEARPWLDDRRHLGVRVKRIVLRGAEEAHEVPVDHPDLTRGWWSVERDGQIMSRWTDGEAVLPLPAMRGTVMLEVHLAGAMTYVVDAVHAGETGQLAAA
jgi:hypothetical protein